MATCRVAEAADSRGVDFQFAGVGAHPAHSGLAVVDLCWEFVSGRESIVDRNGGVAMFGETFCNRGEVGPCAHPPRATVNDQHCRERSGTVRAIYVGS